MSDFFKRFPTTPYDFNGDGVTTRIADLTRSVRADPSTFDDLSTYAYYSIRDGDRPDTVSSELYGTPSYHWTLFLVNDKLRGGLADWPMDQRQLERYMDLEYDGTVIETRPTVIQDSDGLVIDHRDSLAGRFDQVDELVLGAISGASGRVVSKDAQLSQLVLTDVTGNFQVSEAVTGQTTSDSVSAYRVWDWRLAPHHYEDASGLVVYNALHISEQGGTGVEPGRSDSEVVPVSNLEWETRLNDARAEIRVVRPELVAEFARVWEKLLRK